MRNDTESGTTVDRAIEFVRGRLPAGWRVDLAGRGSAVPVLTVVAPGGSGADLSVLVRKGIGPRDVTNLCRQGHDIGGPLFVVAPFLSPRTRELLVESEASFADLTGNIRLVIAQPAVFLERQGAERQANLEPRALRSLKGPGAGRVVRALCDFVPPYGVRRLAEVAASALGTTSRVVSFLEEEALLTRDPTKRIVALDWPALLRRWANDYDLQRTNASHAFLEPRGLAALGVKLGRLPRYAATGSLAGVGVAPTRLAVIYVDDPVASANALELVPTDAGANVLLLRPYDDVVFERTHAVPFNPSPAAGLVTAAAPSQAAVDLLTSPGRGPAEGEALIEKMKENEHAWRQTP